jgi:hypothetical protein
MVFSDGVAKSWKLGGHDADGGMSTPPIRGAEDRRFVSHKIGAEEAGASVLCVMNSTGGSQPDIGH